MELKGTAKLLRIFFGETDKIGHAPLYEAIIKNARSAGLAGATAWKGVMSYGKSTRIRTSKILDLSMDLPIILEIVDQEEKINNFLPILHDMFEKAGCGGLITIEKVDIIKYTTEKNG